MTFETALAARASAAGLTVSESVTAQLARYYELLSRWNRTINLTGLPLQGFPDSTVDRLLIEPLVAANFIDRWVKSWVDLGSGGGSPAIPLKIARPSVELLMVESKARKTVFLKEAIHHLRLEGASAIAERFETLSTDLVHSFDLVTVRAVRADAPLAAVAASLVKRHGKLLIFGRQAQPLDGFQLTDSTALPGDGSFLNTYEPGR